MKILALDVSTKTGWALFNGDKIYDFGTGGTTNFLLGKGLIQNPKKVHEWGEYPWGYLNATEFMAQKILELVTNIGPDVIVIEETNGSKSRYTQKVLEFIHCNLLYRLFAVFDGKVFYINSSEWRKVLGLSLSKEDKKANKKLNVAKKLSETTGKKLNRTELGIKGKVTKKHISVRYVNETYGLKLKLKDNDIADAICIGTAYLKGCQVCDGK
jgi:hypothetical protein